jgi:putative transposase
VKFAFIRDAEKAFPVAAMCRVLGVSRSGYYAWKTQVPSKRARDDAGLLVHVRAVFKAHRRYGSPRVHRELRAVGVPIGRHRVARLMRADGLRVKQARRFVATTASNHDFAIAPNLVRRDFTVAVPNAVWAADITYLPTREGWLYLAVILDLYSRVVVGWNVTDHLRAELAVDALRSAIARRRPKPGLIHHSDRGVQYACDAYRDALKAVGAKRSMSRKGDCWDNAPVESFFGSLKRELLDDDRVFATHVEARWAVFDYIEWYYNQTRRHSALDYVSPAQYEKKVA